MMALLKRVTGYRRVIEPLAIMKAAGDLPRVKKAKMQGVRRTVHCAAHTKRATRMSAKLPLRIPVETTRRAIGKAFLAVEALSFFLADEARVDWPSQPLDSKKKRDAAPEERITYFLRSSLTKSFHERSDGWFEVQIHFLFDRRRVAKHDVIRQKKVLFGSKGVAFFPQYSHEGGT